MRLRPLLACSILSAAALPGCGDPAPPPSGGQTQPASFDRLSDWELFADLQNLTPARDVVPYDVNAPLFTDYAEKRRFVKIPAGQPVDTTPAGDLSFPEGSVLVKAFAYPGSTGELEPVEVRLLVREKDRFRPYVYVMDESGLDAVRKVAGASLRLGRVDPQGNRQELRYLVPNENECHECHGEGTDIEPLGAITEQLDRSHDYGAGPESQLEHFASLGWFEAGPGEPDRLVDPFGDAPLGLRARSYLHANCAHCHSAKREASQSGLMLSFSETDPAARAPASWGECKIPTSAGGATCGLTFDIVPGDPDQSILLCRLASVDPTVAMPPLGRALAHDEGIALIAQWITGNDRPSCFD